MTALAIYDSPQRSADLFHAVPKDILDPFLLVERDGELTALIWQAEVDKVIPLGIAVVDPYAVGRDELLSQGLTEWQVELETCVRFLEHLGIDAVRVPFGFPTALADRFREAGVSVEVDPETFKLRRRVKTPEQLDGHRRASQAAAAAMARAGELIRALPEGLTAEAVRAELQAVCAERGCELPDDVIVAPGPQGALGHESGFGPIRRGDPVIVDLWPQDRRSRCWSDMTRTFIAGGEDPDPRVAEWHRQSLDSLSRVLAEVRPGASCRELFERSCEPYHEAGEPTQLSKEPGTVLDRGFWWALGHGVGLEIHEPPYLGRSPDALMEGDVIAIEPGCGDPDVGCARVEDLVVVTAGGAEILTVLPYDL